ncbi:MAG: hypothetical protein ACREPG_06095, partial [Candidatus Binatia bacterium]
AQVFEKKAAAVVLSEFGSSSLVVIKDPRICRMAPFWFKVLNRAGYSARVIIPVRSPLEVATSLQARYGFDVATSLVLWLRHTLDAEAASRNLPRAVINWPDFLADWRLITARAGELFGVSWPGLSNYSQAEIDQFLTPALRHFSVAEKDFDCAPEVNDWVRLTYEAMIALANEPASSMALRTLDVVKAEFERGSMMFGRVLISLQAHATNVDREAAAARAERDALVGERDRLLEEAAQYRQRVDALASDRAILAEQLAKSRGMLAHDAISPIAHAAPQVAAGALRRESLPQPLEIAERDAVAARPSEPPAVCKTERRPLGEAQPAGPAQHETRDKALAAVRARKGRKAKADAPDPVSALRLEAAALRRNVESLQCLVAARRAAANERRAPRGR